MSRGLSQNALAAKLGIQPNAVSQCERGLNSRSLRALAEFFGETEMRLLERPEFPSETNVAE
jgi:transcriptional regulator with XRE-family HTH domain